MCFPPRLAIILVAALFLSTTAVVAQSSPAQEKDTPLPKASTTAAFPQSSPAQEKDTPLPKATRHDSDDASHRSPADSSRSPRVTETQKEYAEAEKQLNEDLKQPDSTAGWTPELVCKLSLGIGAFAILCFLLVAFLIWQKKNAEHVLRTFGILVIIFAAVFLVIAGYSEKQITSVIGLLGTIAGYLLGRRIEPASSSERHQPPNP